MKELFKKYEKMVMKEAWNVARNYRMAHSDVADQANIILHDAYLSWDKDQASFSTHLFNNLKALQTWAKREKRSQSFEDMQESQLFSKTQATPSAYKDNSSYMPVATNVTFGHYDNGISTNEILNSVEATLSDDAKLLFKLITTGAIDSIGENDERFREMSKNRISKYCQSILSWKPTRVKETLEEMQDWYDSEIAFS